MNAHTPAQVAQRVLKFSKAKQRRFADRFIEFAHHAADPERREFWFDVLDELESASPFVQVPSLETVTVLVLEDW